MFYKILINILQFTITQILGNSGACVNSVPYSGYISRVEMFAVFAD